MKNFITLLFAALIYLLQPGISAGADVFQIGNAVTGKSASHSFHKKKHPASHKVEVGQNIADDDNFSTTEKFISHLTPNIFFEQNFLIREFRSSTLPTPFDACQKSFGVKKYILLRNLRI